MSLKDLQQKINHVDGLARSSLLRPDEHLDKAISNSEAHQLPKITVSPLQGQFLSIQAQLLGAKEILELGALGGYSTLHLAKTGAHVTSIEIDPKHQDITVQNTKGQGFENVDVILGDALEVLPRLEKEKGRAFDMVFIDAAWDLQAAFFEWAVKLTRKGGCIYVDNVVREVFEQRAGEAPGGGLLEKVGKNDKVQATMISTISSHKSDPTEMVDGFLMAIVKE